MWDCILLKDIFNQFSGLTKIYGAAYVLQQACKLCGFQVGEGCLVLGDPLVQVGQLALNGLLHSPLL